MTRFGVILLPFLGITVFAPLTSGQQDEVTAESDAPGTCFITTNDTRIDCPADTIFALDGAENVLEAELQCPFDIVEEKSLFTASAEGDCTCETSLLSQGITEEIECDCFLCPQNSNLLFSFACKTAIMGSCTSFNCDGECNGRGNPGATLSPSATPNPSTAENSASFSPTASPTSNSTTAVPEFNVTSPAPSAAPSERVPTAAPSENFLGDGFNDCSIGDDSVVCPAMARYQGDGEILMLDANLTCPIEAVQESGLVNSSQNLLCTCDTAIIPLDQNLDPNGEPEDISCQCFACPSDSTFRYSYECDTPIVGPCISFGCDGGCNEPALFLPSDMPSLAPSLSNLEPTSSAAPSPAPTIPPILDTTMEPSAAPVVEPTIAPVTNPQTASPTVVSTESSTDEAQNSGVEALAAFGGWISGSSWFLVVTVAAPLPFML